MFTNDTSVPIWCQKETELVVDTGSDRMCADIHQKGHMLNDF